MPPRAKIDLHPEPLPPEQEFPGPLSQTKKQDLLRIVDELELDIGNRDTNCTNLRKAIERRMKDDIAILIRNARYRNLYTIRQRQTYDLQHPEPDVNQHNGNAQDPLRNPQIPGPFRVRQENQDPSEVGSIFSAWSGINLDRATPPVQLVPAQDRQLRMHRQIAHPGRVSTATDDGAEDVVPVDRIPAGISRQSSPFNDISKIENVLYRI